MKQSKIRTAAYYPIAVCLTLGALIVTSELGLANISGGLLWNADQKEQSFAEKSQIQEPSEVLSKNESELGYEVTDTTTLPPVIK
jgi:hypothetical protein